MGYTGRKQRPTIPDLPAQGQTTGLPYSIPFTPDKLIYAVCIPNQDVKSGKESFFQTVHQAVSFSESLKEFFFTGPQIGLFLHSEHLPT